MSMPGSLILYRDVPRPCKVLAIWQAVGKILAQPYCRRRWVYQEVVLARDAVVMCGAKTAVWKNFLGLPLALYQVVRKLDDIPLDRWEVMQAAKLDTISKFKRSSGDGEAEAKPWTMLELLQTTQEMECTEHKDHIFSLLGVASDRDSFPAPDYQLAATQVHTALHERRSNPPSRWPS
jgi:hypothetical protein